LAHCNSYETIEPCGRDVLTHFSSNESLMPFIAIELQDSL